MTEYQKQAKDFLTSCNATMEIEFVGFDINQSWNENIERAKYRVTIKTPRGSMTVDFWDSEMNTSILKTTEDQYSRKIYGRHYDGLLMSEKGRILRELKALKKEAKPSEYSILACLTHYDPGTMHDFFDEMGYEIDSVDDMFCFMNTYNAVVKEYRDLCRIFTEAQMEALREIN
jgi:hypothetical protein